MSDSPAADWWCWTDSEPSTFRCRERGHDVRPSRPPAGGEEIERLRAELAQVRADAKIVAFQLAAVCQFASAYEPGERSWQVARQDAGPCGECDGPIARGHAVEPLPGAPGRFRHVACPTKDSPPNSGAGPRKEPT